jgi:hypothetical protein
MEILDRMRNSEAVNSDAPPYYEVEIARHDIIWPAGWPPRLSYALMHWCAENFQGIYGIDISFIVPRYPDQPTRKFYLRCKSVVDATLYKMTFSS